VVLEVELETAVRQFSVHVIEVRVHGAGVDHALIVDFTENWRTSPYQYGGAQALWLA
jgi:hypothetical protein